MSNIIPHEGVVNDGVLDYPVLTEKGAPKAIVANAICALNRHPVWTGVLAFDTFSLRTAAVRPTPWEKGSNAAFEPRGWTDTDDILTAEWLQINGLTVGPQVARQAVEIVARRQGWHPVTEYLEGLEWDRRDRLGDLASTYLGAEKTDYTIAVSQAFLTGAVARVKRPGCKMDAMPVFEGQQGIGKNRALQVLFTPWFSEEMANLSSKDAAMQLRGAWCVVIDELDAFSKAETTQIKAFLSRQIDRFRPPYGSRVEEFPRQCVFAGTTNKRDYLRDATGNRRFWPLGCGRVDIEAIERDRDQLWAEARTLYEVGQRWWFDEEVAHLARREQKDRYVGDPWEEAVQRWISDRQQISIGEILQRLGKEEADQTQADQNRVVRILTAEQYDCGAPIWERKQRRIDGGKPRWLYIRQPDPAALVTPVTALRVVGGYCDTAPLPKGGDTGDKW